MPLSSNSLFHFTNSKEKLMGILSENFRLGYCKESWYFSEKQNTFHVPMVSFCDIPLSEIKDHIEKYGNYGIGMTRAWGRKSKLNPVLYLEPNSTLSLTFRSALNRMGALTNELVTKKAADAVEAKEVLSSFIDLLGYVKNYEADLVREDGTTPNYRFSDEREWRFVPESPVGTSHLMTQEKYKSEDGIEACRKLTDETHLLFDPNDIKYIIVKDDSDIKEFVAHLQHAKGTNYSYNDVVRLTTRILTVEQIKQDV